MAGVVSGIVVIGVVVVLLVVLVVLCYKYKYVRKKYSARDTENDEDVDDVITYNRTISITSTENIMKAFS